MTHDRETRLRMKIDSLRDECERLNERCEQLERRVKKHTDRAYLLRLSRDNWRAKVTGKPTPSILATRRRNRDCADCGQRCRGFRCFSCAKAAGSFGTKVWEEA